MVGLLNLVYWLLRRRIRYSWGMLALTSFGILAAVTLMATGAFYSRALSEAGLRHSLASQSADILNAQVTAQNRPLGPADYQPLRQRVEDAAQSRVGGLLRGIVRLGRSQVGMPVTEEPVSPSRPQLSGRPFFMTGFQEHTRLVEGRWPRTPGTLGDAGAEMEAVIGAAASRSVGFGVGSRVFVWPFPGDSAQSIALNIVGVVEPVDTREEYWLGAPTYFRVAEVGDLLVVPFYVAEDDFFGAMGTRFPTLVGDFGFNLFLDPRLVTYSTVDAIQEALVGLETDINKRYPRTLVLSRLGLTLDEFKRDLTLARIPLYVFISLFVILVMYFLVLIAGIAGRTQAVEAGLLRSRGASVPQVSAVLALAEGTIGLAAVAVGPLLAWAIGRYLLLPTIDPLGGRDFPLGLSGDMFWMGAAGAVLAVAALVATAVGRARLAMVESLSTRSRPPSSPFLLRYYFDIVAVLAVALIWWQIKGREGFVAQELADRGLEVDPTIVLGPVLGLFAAAVLLMRVLPLAVRALAWVGDRSGPAWAAFSLVRLARDPVPHASMAVMLMLAAALAVFGATLQSSLSNSQQHQALYRVGGDLVAKGPGVDARRVEQVAAIPGVAAVTPVLRGSPTLVGVTGNTSANLLAVDPDAFSKAAWFRDDFSDQDLGEMAARLRASDFGDAAGLPVPEGTGRIGVWINVSELEGQGSAVNLNIWARLRDSRGLYRNIALGNLSDDAPGMNDSGGWRFMVGELPDALGPDAWPLEVVALFLSGSSFTKVTAAGLYLDDVTALGGPSATESVVLEGFEEDGGWRPFAIEGPEADEAVITPEAAYQGTSGLLFRWREPLAGGTRGVLLPPVAVPIPAVGGPAFQVGQEVRVMHGKVAAPLRIVATARHFPTIPSTRRPLILVNIHDYQRYLELLPGKSQEAPEEMWMAVDPDANREAVSARIAAAMPGFLRIEDRRQAADLAQRNPLAGGGWNGLTALGMTAVGVAAALALSASALVSVRQARTDLAVARAIGFSRRQLLFAMSFERLLIAVMSIAAGAAIGYWPGLQLMEMMDLTSRGLPAVPPLIPAVHEWLLTGALAGLLAAAAVAAVFAVAQARRLDTAETLREAG